MRRLSYIITGLLMLSLPVPLISCSDADDYKPGAEVSESCPAAYFSNGNKSTILVTDDGDKKVSVTVCRKNTEGNVTVPITVDSYEGDFSFPASVTFNDGEAETNYEVPYTTYAAGMNFSLSIPEEYTNPYLKVDGTSTFSAALTQLKKVCNVGYYTDNRFKNVTDNVIYAYSGLNRFMWKNFLGSGKDLTFTVSTSNTTGAEFDPDDLTKLKGDFIPLDYCSQDAYGYHFVVENNSEDYVKWTPAGSDEEVTGFYLYGYYNNYTYSYIDFSNNSSNYGYFYSSVVYTASGYNYENIYFYLYY